MNGIKKKCHVKNKNTALPLISINNKNRPRMKQKNLFLESISTHRIYFYSNHNIQKNNKIAQYCLTEHRV